VKDPAERPIRDWLGDPTPENLKKAELMMRNRQDRIMILRALVRALKEGTEEESS
jgi:hypothetical protein